MQIDATENTDSQTLSSTKMSNNTRLIVIQTLLKVQQGLSLSALLDPLLNKVNPKDKSFIHALLLTTLRHWHATERLMDSLAKQPIDEPEVRTTIQVGMTQILYLEVADHACIFETVEAVKKVGLPHASGLVNAILRKVSSNPSKFRKRCDKKHSLPNWLAWQLKQDWSDVYDELVASLRHSAPMYLRVNARQTTSVDYKALLTEAEIDCEVQTLTTELHFGEKVASLTTNAVRLESSTSVMKLPNFETGMASVQDMHAMLAGSLVTSLVDGLFTAQVELLTEHATQTGKPASAVAPLHLLDACTAPSGKLAHCLELFNSDTVIKVGSVKVGVDGEGNEKTARKHLVDGLKSVNTDGSAEKTQKDSPLQLILTALDNDQARLERSEQTLERIGLTDEAKLVCGDATRWQASKDEPEQFDIILLDAPCTATGVIRRHPDIALLRQEDDIEATVALQSDILDNLWKQLKPNGCLVYATCSLFKAENSQQMQAFIDRQDARTVTEIKISGNWGIEQTVGRQCLPLDINGGDGFYYAVLQKVVAQ